jgi:hypothetical protein
VTGPGRIRPAARRLRVEVDAAPRPALLRSAIEARLAGRPAPIGPERVVADAVAEALAAPAGAREGAPWR